MAVTQPLERRRFDEPDEVRERAPSRQPACDVTSLPPGHDAWVLGDEAVVAIDWHRALDRAHAAR